MVFLLQRNHLSLLHILAMMCLRISRLLANGLIFVIALVKD